MEKISFDELLEMTATGCPKPSMRAVELARSYGVKLHVRSAFSWAPGTWVTQEDSMERAIISAVTHDTSEAKMTVSGVADKPGVAATLFRALADQEVNVDMIVQNVSSEGVTDISFTVPIDQLGDAEATATSLQDEIGASGYRGRRPHRPSESDRRRDANQSGRGGTHVRDDVAGGHQHRHDLHISDSNLLRHLGRGCRERSDRPA